MFDPSQVQTKTETSEDSNFVVVNFRKYRLQIFNFTVIVASSEFNVTIYATIFTARVCNQLIFVFTIFNIPSFGRLLIKSMFKTQLKTPFYPLIHLPIINNLHGCKHTESLCILKPPNTLLYFVICFWISFLSSETCPKCPKCLSFVQLALLSHSVLHSNTFDWSIQPRESVKE